MIIRCLNCMKEYEDSGGCCPDCGFVRGTPPKELFHLYPETLLAERYVIGTVIAYGGFGILYKAWDQKLQVIVAVKEYFPSSYVNRNPGEKEIFIYTNKRRDDFKEGLESFLDEARNTAKFSSYPNIVNVYDYFKENGTAYMVMEFMDGLNLKQYTKQSGGKLNWQEAVRILTSICDDLQVVHEAGILHRDISPDNIMLCKDGSIKLFDFGAARFSDSERDVTRTIILKIGFAPPEQYRKKSRQGPWTDIYALGATLYCIITGILPDESENRQAAIVKEGKDTLPRPNEYVPELPKYLNTAILKAMAIQPELRFKNVKQFKDALLNKKQYAEVEQELKNRKRRRKIGIAALLAVAVVGISSCFFYYHSRQAEATLRGANVTIWTSIQPGQEPEEQQNVYQMMLEEFCRDYPGVKVELTCIPEDTYTERLTEARTAGEFPTLYEKPDGNELEERQADLSDILELIQPGDYYFLSCQYLGDEVRQLPLGMTLPVLYVNTSLKDAGGTPQVQNDTDAFLNGKSMWMVSDIERYREVQEHLPGIYAVEELKNDELYVGFKEMWSVDREAGKMNQSAAKRILYYFLGETAQDILQVQNENSLPLNKKELDAYLEINQEFAFLKEQLNLNIPVKIIGENNYQAELDANYKALVLDESTADVSEE